MFGWLKKRRKRRQAERLALDYLRNGDRELARVYVDLALSVVDLKARQYLDGTVLNCVFCGKRFTHDSKHCALGYCQHCS